MKPVSNNPSRSAFPILAALALLTGISIARAADAPATAEAKGKSPAPAAAAPSKTETNALIFRNNRSWNRTPDFEDALAALDYRFDVKPSTEISTVDFSKYRTVIIPGAQRRGDFYGHYLENAELFDRFVTNGGTLLLELNGAENANLPLPGGVSMVSHGARDNAISLKDHPLVEPLQGKPIHANFASHGFLENVPTNAIVIATEMDEGKPLPDKPTYVEYAYGKGRVIAACQCFHDRDGSGRGILMDTAIVYAIERKWFAPKK